MDLRNGKIEEPRRDQLVRKCRSPVAPTDISYRAFFLTGSLIGQQTVAAAFFSLTEACVALTMISCRLIRDYLSKVSNDSLRLSGVRQIVVGSGRLRGPQGQVPRLRQCHHYPRGAGPAGGGGGEDSSGAAGSCYSPDRCQVRAAVRSKNGARAGDARAGENPGGQSGSSSTPILQEQDRADCRRVSRRWRCRSFGGIRFGAILGRRENFSCGRHPACPARDQISPGKGNRGGASTCRRSSCIPAIAPAGYADA